MFPAMLTGITTTSVLTTGALMAPVLIAIGMPAVTVGAMIALVSLLGMVAPPINLLVMLIGQGVDMPYIGFEGPLILLSFPLAIFTSFSLAFKYIKGGKTEDALKELPAVELTKSNLIVFSPLLVVFTLMLLIRLLPQLMPDIGNPLIFLIGAGIGVFTGNAGLEKAPNKIIP